MAPETETEKLGRYEILSELGRGAMGVVYKAIDPLIGRTVAIKTIKFDLSTDDSASFEERFYREAKSAGRLNHPNIVTIYDVGKSDNIAYIAMEFLEGQLLKEILDVHTALSIDKIVDIAVQIADGLAYAHKNGIVHRDIKPANIMLVHGDRVKITDFGIARMSTSSGTLAGTVMGSPRYMAPEQVVGKAVDGRSDLFALGVVLYELLTGESPFDGDNINTTMYRIVNEVPSPPRTLNPRIPEVFDYIVTKSLAKQPEDRYQSAKELATDLKNYKNISIKASVAPAPKPPIPIERKPQPKPQPKPRSNIGEATVFLAPLADGQSGYKTLNGQNKTLRTQAAIPQDGTLFTAQNKKIWVATGTLLAIVLTLILMRDKSASTHGPALAEAPGSKTEAAPPLIANLNPTAPITWQSKTGVSKITPPEVQPSSAKSTSENGNTVLSFAVTPWGDVYLDGKKMGASPPLTVLKVPAGKHKVEIRNVNFAPYSETLHLKADSTKKLKHIFK